NESIVSDDAAILCSMPCPMMNRQDAGAADLAEPSGTVTSFRAYEYLGGYRTMRDTSDRRPAERRAPQLELRISSPRACGRLTTWGAVLRRHPARPPFDIDATWHGLAPARLPPTPRTAGSSR